MRKGLRRLPERLRQRVLRRYPTCWLRYPGCTGASVEIHHILRAADGGHDREFNPDGTPQLVGVCHPCHVAETARQANAWKRRPEKHPGLLP